MKIHKTSTPEMFDKMATRYDVITACLSLGFHRSWKRRIGKFLPGSPDLKILDLATGTGDVAIELAKHHSNIKQIFGLDPAQNMLKRAAKKIKRQNLSTTISLRIGDATCIPFDENFFDAVTISFGIRNMENRDQVYSEIGRVLKARGKLIIMEFSQPRNMIAQFFYQGYMNVVVRFFGGLLLGNFSEFSYLYRSIQEFPFGENFCQELGNQGFCHVEQFPVFLGSATIYVAENPV